MFPCRRFPPLPPGSGNFLVSSSYDASARIWTAPDCAPLKTLKGHDGKVMSVDASPGTAARPTSSPRFSLFSLPLTALSFNSRSAPQSDASLVATVAFDRTVKLWAKE